METITPEERQERPLSVYDELDITLSAVADVSEIEAASSVGAEIGDGETGLDPTVPIVGLARIGEESRPSISIKAEYTSVDRREIFLKVQRVNPKNGNAYSMSYLATQDGTVFSLVEHDGDRAVVQLGDGEVTQILKEVKSCRVAQMG